MMQAHVHYAIKEIRRRKFRTAVNILGYVVAVAFMVMLVSLAQSYSLAAASVLEGVGTHFTVFIPATIESPSQFLAAGPFFKGVYTETFDTSVVDTIKDLPGVEDAAPYLMVRLGNLTIGGIDINRLATETTAVSPGDVVEGRYLAADDYDAVLLDQLFAGFMRLDVGDTIDAFDHTFEVVGTVIPSMYSRPAGVAHMYALIGVVQEIARSCSDLNHLIDGDANAVLVEVAHEGGVEYLNTVKKSVLETLEVHVGKKGSLAGYGCYVPARNVVSITDENAWAISLILVTSVTLFALKSQLGSVVERTTEIGVLKAIGWADSDVMSQILVESVLQGFAGGLFGCCLGYSLVFLVPLVGLISAESLILTLSPSVIITGLIAALIGGIVAGTFPALRAAKLQPAEALRHF
jgi:putative ABC transport system permease protein